MPKPPPRLSLAAEYHDSQLESVYIGPRREIELVVRLDPVWNSGDGTTRRLRFSRIQNFDDVAAFFARIPGASSPGASLDQIGRIVRPGKDIIGIDLNDFGYVELVGARVDEG